MISTNEIKSLQKNQDKKGNWFQILPNTHILHDKWSYLAYMILRLKFMIHYFKVKCVYSSSNTVCKCLFLLLVFAYTHLSRISVQAPMAPPHKKHKKKHKTPTHTVTNKKNIHKFLSDPTQCINVSWIIETILFLRILIIWCSHLLDRYN